MYEEHETTAKCRRERVEKSIIHEEPSDSYIWLGTTSMLESVQVACGLPKNIPGSSCVNNAKKEMTINWTIPEERLHFWIVFLPLQTQLVNVTT